MKALERAARDSCPVFAVPLAVRGEGQSCAAPEREALPGRPGVAPGSVPGLGRAEPWGSRAPAQKDRTLSSRRGVPRGSVGKFGFPRGDAADKYLTVSPWCVSLAGAEPCSCSSLRSGEAQRGCRRAAGARQRPPCEPSSKLPGV